MEQQDKKGNLTIVISPRSIALFTLIPLGIYLLWIVKDLLFSLLIGFILMSALKPAVQFLVKKGAPRSASVVLVYLLFILFFLTLISIIIPPIVIETTNLLLSLPVVLEDLSPQLSGYLDLSDLSRYIPNVTNNILNIIGSIFSNTLFIVSTLFFGAYFLLEENIWTRLLNRYFSEKTAKRVSSVIQQAEKRMSSWFWGEITLMTVVGTFTYIGLSLLGIKYALPLAVLAGLLEAVPNIGPVLSAIPAVILGFANSYFTGFTTLGLYVVIQQFENNLIVPIIMKKAVGLNPIATLIALILGGRLGGVLGVLLSIPLLLFIETIVAEIMNKEPADNVQK